MFGDCHDDNDIQSVNSEMSRLVHLPWSLLTFRAPALEFDTREFSDFLKHQPEMHDFLCGFDTCGF